MIVPAFWISPFVAPSVMLAPGSVHGVASQSSVIEPLLAMLPSSAISWAWFAPLPRILSETPPEVVSVLTVSLVPLIVTV